MGETAGPLAEQELHERELTIGSWLEGLSGQGVGVAGVERVMDQPRTWYVRMDGEEKTHFSMLVKLDQRTLQFESYFMPAPQENHAELFRHLLVRNRRLHDLSFSVGSVLGDDNDGVYLVGRVDSRAVSPDVLDQILGSVWMATEQCFRPAMRIGFASRFQS